jgi:hypothetical protein
MGGVAARVESAALIDDDALNTNAVQRMKISVFIIVDRLRE